MATKTPQLHFFSTKADLGAVLRAIESERKLQFVRTGLFDTAEFKPNTTLLGDPGLGIAVHGDQNHEAAYLVCDVGESVNVRTVPQNNGTTKYAIDQQANPKTIVFRPGGVYNGKCIIAGSIGTISGDPTSLAIFQLFNKAIKKPFVKIKTSYVGKEAAELLDKGWRLTESIKSPELYDLKRKGGGS